VGAARTQRGPGHPGRCSEVAAAQLSHTLRLSMADSIILATTRAHQARLYTLDADFKDLYDVELMQRP
jgi:predicted nucleic acid-binding protein